MSYTYSDTGGWFVVNQQGKAKEKNVRLQVVLIPLLSE